MVASHGSATLAPPVKCAVCRLQAATQGVGCDTCLDELASPVEIAPQQLELRVADTTDSALVDVFGQPYHLAPVTTVGRGAQRDLVILEPSVSRSHAEVTRTRDGWTIRDTSSTCGTFVNEQQVLAPLPLHHGDRVRFGDVAFYFVTYAARLPPPPMRTDPGTVRLPPKDTRRPAPSERPVVPIQLGAPSGGGGGFVAIGGKRVQLTTAQYELIERLVDRMRREAGKPDAVRGFVHPSELIKLSLDSADPTEDHVRHLVSRVRRALVKADIGDLIEGRRGVGYRLRVIPA